jgi:hypothetical protein
MAREDGSAAVQQHMAQTYLNLRIGIAAIGAALPLVLWIGDAVVGGNDLRGSMSAYYHSSFRDIFVGALFGIGAFLYLYKGFGAKENLALNLGGICAIGVAFVATKKPDGIVTFWTRLHGGFAIVLFLCIAYVAIFRSVDTLKLMGTRPLAARLRRTYRSLGVAMAVSPLAAVAFSRVAGSLTFFLEAFAIWAFAAYWFVKSWELGLTDADRTALEGNFVPDESSGRLAPAT